MKRKDMLKVTLLGKFQITHQIGDQEISVSDETSTSKKLWPFLQYLIVFRHKAFISQAEIIDTLWAGDDEKNPVNALKTLLHRARNTMEYLGYPDGKQVILYRRGVYSWNNDLPIQVDAELFSTLYQQTDQATQPQISTMLRAIDLYQGDYLPKYSSSEWVVSIRSECHAKYLSLCMDSAALLKAEERHSEIIDLCRKALTVAPYEESLHLRLVKSLNATGDQQGAIQHYAYVMNLFMDQLGVTLSDEFTAVYRELIKMTQSVQLDLGVVRASMTEDTPSHGPFVCELAIFREIYRREARVTQRTGYAAQLSMISILDSRSKTLTPRQMSIAMERLKNSIYTILRKGDVFTRFSPSQYLLLLPCATREGGESVVRRVTNHYKRNFPKANTMLHSSVLPLLPLTEEEPPILDAFQDGDE